MSRAVCVQGGEASELPAGLAALLLPGAGTPGVLGRRGCLGRGHLRPHR